MLELYHHFKAFLTPLAGGFGPLLALILLFLLVFTPILRWEDRLARKIGPQLAAKRTSWAAGVAFLLVLFIGLFWFSHP